MATYLSERISELSAKMRSNVTARSALGPTASSNIAATDIAKAHSTFQLPKEEKLISVYQCSVPCSSLNSRGHVSVCAARRFTPPAVSRYAVSLTRSRRETRTSASCTSSRSTCASTSRRSRIQHRTLTRGSPPPLPPRRRRTPAAAVPRAPQVFAFHKQWVLDVTETVAFLKSQVSAPCSSARHAPAFLVHPRSAGCRDAARRRGAG